MKKEIIIDTNKGKIKGIVEKKIMKFLSIPYAKPPINNLRWKLPEEKDPWSDVLDCLEPPKACPQHIHHMDVGPMSEDCLYLNIWAVEEKKDLPVMVWVHGGSFTYGSSMLNLYMGDNLALKDVIVVTLNYRLGVFGFLTNHVLKKNSSTNSSGNYGLLDVVQALKWIKENIHQFGGNPDNVTLFGESSGATSICALLVSNLAKGLFSKAIMQSGGPIGFDEIFRKEEDTYEEGDKFFRLLEIYNDKNLLEKAYRKSTEDILKAFPSRKGFFNEGMFFCPVVDKYLLEDKPKNLLLLGKYNKMPIITGSNADEGTLFIIDMNVEDYHFWVDKLFGKYKDILLKVFPAQDSEEVAIQLNRLITVGGFAFPSKFLAKNIDNSYLYQFTRKPETEKAKVLGCYHGLEIGYVFGNINKKEGYDKVDFDLSEVMQNYWVDFAKGNALENWSLYDSEKDMYMEFGDKVKTEEDLFSEICDELEGIE